MAFDLATGLRDGRSPGGTAFVVGAKTNVDTAPAPVGSDTDILSEVIILNDPNNTGDILVGDTATQLFLLDPGAALIVPAAELALLEVKASGADTNITVRYFGTISAS